MRRDRLTVESPHTQVEPLILRTYREMPGLSLHLGQATPLFGLQRPTCQGILEDLVRRGMLRYSLDGQYVTGERNR